MKRKLHKRYPGTVLFLVLSSVLMVFPFVWMFLSAFKTTSDVYAYPPRWIPSSFQMTNFTEVFKKIPFLRFYANSIVIAVIQTFLQILISAMGAFALTKLEFPGRKKLFSFMQSSMYVPEVVTLIPLFLLASWAGLVDTYTGLILPGLQCAFTTILLISFFQTIPNDLIDAAKIDGCGYYRVFLQVILPNSRTALGTASLFAFLTHWRSYIWPLIITNSVKMRTLPIGLKYLVQETASEYQILMAASLMAIIPILVVYMLMEKEFVQSITLTGLKA
ncbi:MAG TPA: carbohydrate ABC transporter permease [Rectinemataceae bacterium]|nr:carbohydrate ABC transporter permease [Rectinemataceae bacterium]